MHNTFATFFSLIHGIINGKSKTSTEVKKSETRKAIPVEQEKKHRKNSDKAIIFSIMIEYLLFFLKILFFEKSNNRIANLLKE